MSLGRWPRWKIRLSPSGVPFPRLILSRKKNQLKGKRARPPHKCGVFFPAQLTNGRILVLGIYIVNFPLIFIVSEPQLTPLDSPQVWHFVLTFQLDNHRSFHQLCLTSVKGVIDPSNPWNVNLKLVSLFFPSVATVSHLHFIPISQIRPIKHVCVHHVIL